MTAAHSLNLHLKGKSSTENEAEHRPVLLEDAPVKQPKSAFLLRALPCAIALSSNRLIMFHIVPMVVFSQTSCCRLLSASRPSAHRLSLPRTTSPARFALQFNRPARWPSHRMSIPEVQCCLIETGAVLTCRGAWKLHRRPVSSQGNVRLAPIVCCRLPVPAGPREEDQTYHCEGIERLRVDLWSRSGDVSKSAIGGEADMQAGVCGGECECECEYGGLDVAGSWRNS